MGSFRALSLPSLDNLVIEEVLTDGIGISTLLHFPSLRVLDITTVNATVKTLVAPRLETLCLTIPTLRTADADHVFQAIFDGENHWPRPRNLSIAAPINDKYLLDALARIPDLHTLTLDHQMGLTKNFFKQLTPPHSRRKHCHLPLFQIFLDKPKLCTNLRNLNLDLRRTPKHDNIARMLKDLIKGRKSSPEYLDLWSVTVKWLDSGRKEQLVQTPIHSTLLPKICSRTRQRTFP